MPTSIAAPSIIAAAGSAVITHKGEWAHYSTGAEYIAVCPPAFSPARVHREL